MMILFPYLISFLTGYLLLRALFVKEKPLDLLSEIFLGFGLGLGLNASLTFLNFTFWGHFDRTKVMTLNLIVFFLMIGLTIYRYRLHQEKFFNFKDFKYPSILIHLAISAVILGILIIFARTYPFGGWDAWSCWNLKSKFLFEAHDWKVMFDPLLWRASPHYPLLLPMMNVWSWSLLKNPSSLGPLWTSVIFSFMTLGLLFVSLKKFSNMMFACLAPLLIIFIPFYLILATSQYADIVVSYYLLGAFFCFLLGLKTREAKFGFLSGAFIGLLSFTKSEGMIAAVILTGLLLIYLLLIVKNFRLVGYLLAGLVAFGLPTMIFQIFFAPENQTFINGLGSTAKPSTVDRLKVVLLGFYFEFINIKWQGIWFVLLGGLVLNLKECFKKEQLLFPIFLVSYLGVVGFYYYLNTYFEIIWWVTVTLNRILFSILPIFVVWVFTSAGKTTHQHK